jgi:hypothetical protein
VAQPTDPPTVEPTVAIIDIANDPNARSAKTPFVPTPPPAPTDVPTPAPTEVTPTADQDLVGSVVAASVDPLLAGGRIGLVIASLSGATYLAVQRLRQRH